TPGTLPGTAVFKTAAIDHSAISPTREFSHIPALRNSGRRAVCMAMTRLIAILRISLLVPAWLLSSSAPAEAQSATQIFRPGLVSMPACSSTFDAPPMMESQLLACIKQLAIDVGAAADPDTKTVQFRSPAIPDGTSAAEAAALEHKALLQEYAGYIIWRRQV